MLPTVKIKSTHPESQGDFVEINKEHFNPEVHELYKPEAAKPGANPDDLNNKTVAELRELAADKKIDLGDATKKADIIAAIEAAKPGANPAS